MERVPCCVRYIGIILTLTLSLQIAMFVGAIVLFEENKVTLASTANNLMSTLNNAQVASKAIMAIAQESGPKVQDFVAEADKNKNMFQETRRKLRELNEPLREVKEILGHDNRDNLHVILQKMRANFDRIDDDDLSNLMHQGLTKDNIKEAMKMIGDVDSTFSKVNKMLKLLK